MKNTLLFVVALLAVGCGEPGRWGTPVKLAPARGEGWVHTWPQIVAAGKGQAMALWHEPLDEDGKRHRVQFSTYDPDRGWHDPETIVETGQSSSASLAMNAAGEVALALSDWPRLSVLRFARGRGWSESRGSVGVGTIGGGEVGIGEDGTVVVLWTEPTRRPPALYASRFSPVTGWGSDDLISSSREPANQPDITDVHLTVDARGNAVAAWDEFTFGEHDSVWTNHAENGAPWASPQRIDQRIDFRDVVLAGNKNGEAIVAWRRNELRVSRFGGGVWTAPEPIAAPKRHVFRSQPGIGDSGDAMVLWLNWDEDGDEPMAVEAVRFDRTQGWSAPESLPLAHARVASLHTDVPGGVVIDRDGNATVVWNGEPGIVAYRYEVGRGWSPPQVIGVGYPNGDVKLAVDGVGNVSVIWTSPEGTWVNRFEMSR